MYTKFNPPSQRLKKMVKGLMICLLLLLPGLARAQSVSIDFSGLPGADNRLGTSDDVLFGINDIFEFSPVGGAKMIDTEYSDLKYLYIDPLQLLDTGAAFTGDYYGSTIPGGAIVELSGTYAYCDTGLWW